MARAETPSKGSPLSVLVAACLGLFAVFLQTTQTIGTLSAVQDDLGIAPADLVWVPSMYTLVVASFVLGAGALSDRWGRRRSSSPEPWPWAPEDWSSSSPPACRRS
ncbi:hypothetical protein [Streptomyces crystallinus]|uniref:Major facilitator superfamily (MFS) profile domain-containing protein n=1 Tax=Streptomyces crystallinus TaxID=68191 RepID=A0ABN1FTX3_9ACTN